MREEIDNLLTEFEEMGFCPAPFNRNAQAYACQWRDNMRNAIINHEQDILKEFIEWESAKIKENLAGVSEEGKALVYEITSWFNSDLKEFLEENKK